MSVVSLATLVCLTVAGSYATPIVRSDDAVKYVGYKLYRADVFPGQLPMVDSLDGTEGVEIWNWLYKPSNSIYQMDVLSSPEKDYQVKEVFDDVRLRYDIVIDDLQEAIDTESINESPLIDNRYGHPMTWETYHSSNDIVQYMHYLEQTYPNSVEVLSVGTTHENRTLYVVKVSTGEPLPDGEKRQAIWVDGGVHAREWISPAVVSYFLQRLVEIPDGDADIVEAFDWYIMPLVNPDGYEYSRREDRLWRKNRSPNNGDPCKGVDLNRNFGYKWNPETSDHSKCSNTYSGSGPFSEPESNAVKDILQKIQKELRAYVTIHSYKQLWMYPWAFTNAPLNSSHNEIVSRVASNVINDFAKSDQYNNGRMADILYAASGVSTDYAFGELKIPYSFSLELRDRGEHGFLLPKEQIVPTAEETSVGLFAMAEEILRQQIS